MSHGLSIGSLFSGIGGLELGLEMAGLGPVKWQVERDPFCLKVLAKHWPDAKRYDNVCTATGLEPVDIICGGFPCQDLSKAGNVQGRRKGLDGERSGLWREYARIVGDVRPRYVVVENVPALLVRGLGTVLSDLHSLGYDAEWGCIPASYVGAPHIRDRVFILAYANSQPVLGGGHPPTFGPARGRSREIGEWERLWTHPEPMGPGAGVAGDWTPGAWESEPRVGRVADGVPQGLDRLRALGNAVVPQVAKLVGECIFQHATGASR